MVRLSKIDKALIAIDIVVLAFCAALWLTGKWAQYFAT